MLKCMLTRNDTGGDARAFCARAMYVKCVCVCVYEMLGMFFIHRL